MKNYVISEGIAGVWSYHLTEVNKKGIVTKALCGSEVMSTSIPLIHWGDKSDHIPMSYCKECERLYIEETIG